LAWLNNAYERMPNTPMDLVTLWQGIQDNIVTATRWHPIASFWTKELSKLKRKRNKAYRIRNQSEQALERFKTLDKQFKHSFHRAKRAFQREEVENICKNDPSGSKAWAICKQLDTEMRGRKKKTWRTQTVPPDEQTNHIAEKFASISNDPVLDPSDEEQESYERLLSELNSRQSRMPPISTEEIYRAIARARSKGAAGSDRITPTYLKMACQFTKFMNAFKSALNNALVSGRFPDEWKIAKVIPLPKPNPDDFRPISLLSIMGKIFEKILEQRLRESVQTQLSSIQHGCRPGHNTAQALCRFAHSCGLARANNLHFGAIAFDFSKAYDRVPRYRLVMKLVDLGVPDPLILIIDNWLTNRQLSVYNRGVQSAPLLISHGIPQGSSLSVLLWLIYINDLGTTLDPQSSNIYVDDSLVWASGPTRHLTNLRLHAQARKLARWAQENKVYINWSKTQLIYDTQSVRNPPLKVGEHMLYPTTRMRYLGVDFISNNEFGTLTYDLKAIGADLRRRAAIVRRLKRFSFPRKTIRTFTEGFVYAKLRYLTPILGAEIHHKPTLEPLKKGVNAAMRTELDAFMSTPIPLLYAGSGRPRLEHMISRDSTRLILRSIAHDTQLGQDYLDWNGSGDGWTPLGTVSKTLTTISSIPANFDILPLHPLSIRVRDALQRCKYHIDYTKGQALSLHMEGRLIRRATVSLWCDGSFQHETQTIGAAALWVDSSGALIETRMDSQIHASSSYEGERLALLTGLQMLRDKGIQRQTIRIYTDSKSILTHLRAAGYRYKYEEDTLKECAHLIARLLETNSIAFHWIPAHQGIGYNAQADFYAKSALRSPTVHLPRPIRVSTIDLHLCKNMYLQSRSDTRAEISESQFRDYPSREPFTNMTRKNMFSGPIFVEIGRFSERYF
jgi:ribonuclease HI